MAASIFLKSVAKKISNKIVIADLDFGLQQPQNGTGHAIQKISPQLKGFS